MIIICHEHAFLPFEFTMSAVGEPRFSAGSIANWFAYCVNARNDYFLFFFSSAQFTFYRIILHESNSEILRLKGRIRNLTVSASVCSYMWAHARCPVLISVDKYLSQCAVYFGRLGKDITQLNFCSDFFYPSILYRVEYTGVCFCKAMYDVDTGTWIYIKNVLRRALELQTEKLGHWNYYGILHILCYASKFRFPM